MGQDGREFGVECLEGANISPGAGTGKGGGAEGMSEDSSTQGSFGARLLLPLCSVTDNIAVDLFFIDSIGANEDEEDFSDMFERLYSYETVTTEVLGRDTQESSEDALDGQKGKSVGERTLRYTICVLNT